MLTSCKGKWIFNDNLNQIDATILILETIETLNLMIFYY